MSDVNITQLEADTLIKIEKNVLSDKFFIFPNSLESGKEHIPLISIDEKEEFILTIARKQLILEKQNHLLRVRKAIVLLRLDINSSPHRNPDDQEVSGTHLHIYKEGFSDKWAVEVPLDKFSNLHDMYQTCTDFMNYCNINKKPNFQKDLFV